MEPLSWGEVWTNIVQADAEILISLLKFGFLYESSQIYRMLTQN